MSQPFVWVRCDDIRRIAAISAIADRLAEDGDAVRFGVTIKGGAGEYPPHPKGRETPNFLKQFQPLATIIIGGVIDSQVVAACAEAQVPIITVDARPDTLREMTGGWFRAGAKPVLSDIEAAFTADARLVETLQKLGVSPDKTFNIGPLEQPVRMLPHDETARAAAAERLRNRPVWFARAATLSDVDVLAQAHGHASRLSHRLLLCVSPAMPVDGPELEKAFKDKGFLTHLRSRDQALDETVQVYITDFDGEDGLWLRLAPITYVCGTFTRGAAHDPFESAALGSVVLHGGQTQPFTVRFQRLHDAKASLLLTEPSQLGAAVTSILPPDKTAELALAGWSVTSSGAEISSRIAAIIQDRLDQVGG